MPASTPAHTWASTKAIEIPTTDILTFAFENLDRFDNNKPIFIDTKDPTKSFSAAQAHQLVRQLAKGFKEYGLKDGECVCLHSYNRIEYPVIWLGIIAAGGIVSGSNPGYTALELIRHFKVTKPKFIVAQAECLRSVLEATCGYDIARHNIFCLGNNGHVTPVNACQDWATLLQYGECDWNVDTNLGESGQGRLAVYAMTSGTTGLPKAAMISHRYVVAQTSMLQGHFDHRSYQPSQLICLPVFHAFASPLALVLPLRLGISTYFLPRFNLEDFTQAIQRFSITDIPVVPPIVAALNQLSLSDRHLLQNLRYVICAGAPLTAGVQNQLYHVLSSTAVISQCFGTTESGWLTLFDPQEKDLSGSVGRLMPNVELKLIADSGCAISEHDESGEGYFKSPGMFSGYLENSDASSASFDPNGFYRTGDRLHVRDGKLFHDGRMKEIMKVHGWQVSPTELEEVLMQHPSISDAAVVGITSLDRNGIEESLPSAFVVRAPALDSGPILKEEDVKRFVASKVISYKRLVGGVNFVRAIPRSNTGKILRRLLKDAERDPTDQREHDRIALQTKKWDVVLESQAT